MKIAIIGWYGTETIGDRAILAGLLCFLKKSIGEYEILLGSLYPFFSERTIKEDFELYRELLNKEIKITLFNSKSFTEIDKAIKSCDLLAMGGGPLMDLQELYLVEYAFKVAKKNGIKTSIIGCGIGPLFDNKYKKTVVQITKNSDLIILRDEKSKESLIEIYKQFNTNFYENSIKTSYDPAVECAIQYRANSTKSYQDYIAVNLRQFPVSYNRNIDPNAINEQLANFIISLSDKYADSEIKLVPMHYFHIGDDDRMFLNSISNKCFKKNIYIQNYPLSLKETMNIYRNAMLNIGMRYHSVILQTIINGNNFIFDYTEPKKGKIYSFIKDIDNDDFYLKRYFSLQEESINIDLIRNEDIVFNYSEDIIKQKLNVYTEEITRLII